MSLIFSGSPDHTLGVELEILLLDPETKAYNPKVIEVLEQCQTEGISRIKCELHLALIEINTRKTTSFQEMAQRLRTKASKLRAITDKMNIELLMTGAHPSSMWHDNILFPDPRYYVIIDKLQWTARRVNTNGMHLHFGVKNGELALTLMYEFLPYIPLIIALAASSPYWQQDDTGFDSCRQNVMNNLLYSGPAPYFESWEHFNRYVARLKSTGSIQSIKDLHWQIRPNLEFGTVEFRIMDALPTLQETLAVLALIQNLATYLMRNLDPLKRSKTSYEERFWITPENQWEAAKRGLDGMIIPENCTERVKIRDEIKKTITLLSPIAEELGNLKEFLYLEEMLKHGNSASRQREVFKKTGSFIKVIDALVWEFKHDSIFSSEET